MLWKINIIKQNQTPTVFVECLVEASNQQTIRNVLQSPSFLVLSLTPYKQPANIYGQTYVTIEHKQQNIVLLIKEQEVIQTIHSIASLGIIIKDIQSTNPNLNPLEIKKILAQLSKNTPQPKANEIRTATKHTKQYTNQQQQNLKNIAEETISEIQIIKQKHFLGVNNNDQKLLLSYESELKKTKNVANSAKIKEILEKTLLHIEKIQQQHDQYLEKTEQPHKHIHGSQITTENAHSEADKLKIAEVIQKAGTKKTQSTTYYTWLGKSGIYQKFLQKDIIQKLSRTGSIAAEILSLIKLIIFTVTILIGIYFLWTKISGTIISRPHYLLLIHLGAANIALHTVTAYKTTNIILVCIQCVAAFVLYVLLDMIVINNFALT